MTDFITAAAPRATQAAITALESRADIASLEQLQAERRQLIPQYATLRAMHGPNGKFDNYRKAMLEAAKVRARMDLKAQNEKATDASVDAVAHADQSYVDLIEQGIRDATEYVVMETRITEIEEQIRNREFCLTAYSREVGLR